MPKSRGPKKNEAELSPRAAEVRKFMELARAIPNFRQDKIEAIKKQIESGTYTVSAESVAKSMAEHCHALISDKPSKS